MTRHGENYFATIRQMFMASPPKPKHLQQISQVQENFQVLDFTEPSIEQEQIPKSAGKSYFIAFEGPNAAICETHANALAKWLKGHGKSVLKLNYPDYADPYGKLIQKHLAGKIRLTEDKLFLAHLNNQLKDGKNISKNLQSGSFVVTHSYLASNLANNCSEMPLEKAMSVAETLKIPKPNLIFYLKTKEDTLVNKNYEKLAKGNKLGQWVIINGNAPIHQVRTQVLESLWPYLRGS